eukprot:SAG31_NODE_18102_length_646_cov_97.484461_1_plen_180_part_00
MQAQWDGPRVAGSSALPRGSLAAVGGARRSRCVRRPELESGATIPRQMLPRIAVVRNDALRAQLGGARRRRRPNLSPGRSFFCAKPISPDFTRESRRRRRFMLAQVIIRLVPFAATSFIAFFGNLIAHLVRAGGVFWTAAAPAAIPAIMPFINEPETPELTVSTFLIVIGALFSGSMAA